MGMELVPYTFQGDVTPQFEQAPALPGVVTIVHFMVNDDPSWLVEKLAVWFQDRDDISLLGSGQTASGDGYVSMAWLGSGVDLMFYNILQNDPIVDDFSVVSFPSALLEVGA
jgi:hypothetical protein